MFGKRLGQSFPAVTLLYAKTSEKSVSEAMGRLSGTSVCAAED